MAGRVFSNHAMLQVPTATLHTYNAWDCVATVRSALALRTELEDNGQAGFWDREFWPLVPAVLDMQARGMLFDKDARSRLRREVRKQLEQLDNEIVAADPTGELRKPTGNYHNGLNAPRRVATFLFDTLGLKPTRFTETNREPAVSQDALQSLLQSLRKKDEHARPVLYNLFHRSRLKTIDQRYLDPPIDPDGRVRSVVKMAGTETGRFAYDRPPLQQYPPEIRHLFKAAPDHVFIWADYSQLEARIAAYLSGDKLDIETFEAGADIHSQTACDLFGWTAADVDGMQPDRLKAARNFAKTFRYGLLYGGKPETMKMKTFCPCPRCEAKLPPTLELPRLRVTESSQRWLAKHPAILSWRDQIAAFVREHRSLTNAIGRKRFFFTPWPGCRREAYNFPIQSLAADLVNRAMRTGFAEYELPHVLQMHDSLMIEVPLVERDVRLAQLREVMEAPVPELGGVSFPVDVEWGERWSTPL